MHSRGDEKEMKNVHVPTLVIVGSCDWLLLLIFFIIEFTRIYFSGIVEFVLLL